MKQLIGFAVVLAALGCLAACDTTTHTNAPDVNSLQPTKQDIQQDRLNRAMQS